MNKWRAGQQRAVAEGILRFAVAEGVSKGQRPTLQNCTGSGCKFSQQEANQNSKESGSPEGTNERLDGHGRAEDKIGSNIKQDHCLQSKNCLVG
eukprot:1834239-Pleurochrysis_carterae.AAC.2